MITRAGCLSSVAVLAVTPFCPCPELPLPLPPPPPAPPPPAPPAKLSSRTTRIDGTPSHVIPSAARGPAEGEMTRGYVIVRGRPGYTTGFPRWMSNRYHS